MWYLGSSPRPSRFRHVNDFKLSAFISDETAVGDFLRDSPASHNAELAVPRGASAACAPTADRVERPAWPSRPDRRRIRELRRPSHHLCPHAISVLRRRSQRRRPDAERRWDAHRNVHGAGRPDDAVGEGPPPTETHHRIHHRQRHPRRHRGDRHMARGHCRLHGRCRPGATPPAPTPWLSVEPPPCRICHVPAQAYEALRSARGQKATPSRPRHFWFFDSFAGFGHKGLQSGPNMQAHLRSSVFIAPLDRVMATFEQASPYKSSRA